MAWYNPFSWGRRKPDRDDAQFSRTAIDSSDEPMVDIFSMRIPHDLRILGGRKARMLGLSLGEYMRLLLARAVDDDDSLPDTNSRSALRSRGR